MTGGRRARVAAVLMAAMAVAALGTRGTGDRTAGAGWPGPSFAPPTTVATLVAAGRGERMSAPVEVVICTPASLAERAARTLVVGLPETTGPDDPLVAEVTDVGVGGVLLTHANVESTDQVRSLVSALRERSRRPLVVSADEEPGRVKTFGAITGPEPSARRMAAEGTPDDVRDAARASAQLLDDLGVDVNLAPVADLDAGPWDGVIGDRSYSDDPETAATYALAYARGMVDGGVVPVVKHFPGHGRTDEDDHFTAPTVDTPLEDLVGTDLRPFSRLVGAGAPVVMMGHVAFDAIEPGVPASLSQPAYRLLRDLGFAGVAITDSIGMGAVNLRWDYGRATVKAIAAGADGVLGTDGWSARWMRDALVEAVETGELPEARLDEAAARMAALAGDDPRSLTCAPAALPALE
ncbi:MAG: glycoside hydrolase family 3 N-terminal domain-containing protein [Actinomycetota bacterium]